MEPFDCPICGGSASYQAFNVHPSCKGRIVCSCGLELRHGTGETREQAIAKWNHRTVPMTMQAMRNKQYQFEEYMTCGRWDSCCAEGIYEDDGIRAVSMFLEFAETGRVTDDDGEELRE